MPIDWFPLWLSLRVASVSTVAGLGAGLWIAYILANREFRGKEVVDAAVTLPAGAAAHRAGLLSAGAAGALQSSRTLVGNRFRLALAFTWKAAVVASLLYSLPLLVKSSRAALESVDRSCERAARTLGAK